ncbi:hypothetical protein GCM10008967_33830 [Bacillus carboniphilus]|uniref:Tetratricopeptide repeat protein n=1 Tax=Bacillus carboniphilus TaxID=86663 RepID=A0ABN0WLQ2_9BACI
MTHNQCITVQHKKKSIELTIHRMAMFHAIKVIEAYDENHNCYLLYFYKNQYLTYKKTPSISLISRLQMIFTKGIMIHAPHPLIHEQVGNTRYAPFYSFNQLLPKLESQYTQQETAFIFSFFDNYISKEKLVALFKKHYNQFRRDGQFFKAYQLLRTCLDFAPENTWAQDMSHNLQYHSYEKLYDAAGASLLSKDPLFAEIQLFQNRQDRDSFIQLQDKLSTDSRWVDQIGLYIDQVNTANQQTFLSLLSSHLSEEATAKVLRELLKKEHLPLVQDTLFNILLNLRQYEEAINTMAIPHAKLSDSQFLQIQDIFENQELDSNKLHTQNFNQILVHQTDSRKLEKMLRLCVPLLFQKHEFSYIDEWLEPLRERQLSLPTLQKINLMKELKDDPERQLLLGELYYEFKQYELAIDCFSFDMELRPTSAEPIQWLAKSYRDMGKLEEATSYQNVLSMMQKRA